MELCTVRVISNLPPLRSAAAAPRHIHSLFPCRTRSPFILNHTRFSSGLTYCVNSPLSSTTSGETLTETATPYGTDKPETGGLSTAEDASADEKEAGTNTEMSESDKLETDGAVTAGYAPPVEKKEVDEPETVSVAAVETTSLDEKKEDSVAQLNEATEETSLPDLQLSKFLEDLGIKIDFEENKYSLIAVGGGGLLALWLASAVVGAIDRIPLFPKLMELVGLGYSIWFTIRYLLFEESRGNLVAKVKQTKEDILG